MTNFNNLNLKSTKFNCESYTGRQIRNFMEKKM